MSTVLATDDGRPPPLNDVFGCALAVDAGVELARPKVYSKHEK